MSAVSGDGWNKGSGFGRHISDDPEGIGDNATLVMLIMQ